MTSSCVFGVFQVSCWLSRSRRVHKNINVVRFSNGSSPLLEISTTVDKKYQRTVDKNINGIRINFFYALWDFAVTIVHSAILSTGLEYICRVSGTLYCHLLRYQWRLESVANNINGLYLGHDGPLIDFTPKLHRSSVAKNINGFYPGYDHLATDRW